jgi:hypothetical protein
MDVGLWWHESILAVAAWASTVISKFEVWEIYALLIATGVDPSAF